MLRLSGGNGRPGLGTNQPRGGPGGSAVEHLDQDADSSALPHPSAAPCTRAAAAQWHLPALSPHAARCSPTAAKVKKLRRPHISHGIAPFHTPSHAVRSPGARCLTRKFRLPIRPEGQPSSPESSPAHASSQYRASICGLRNWCCSRRSFIRLLSPSRYFPAGKTFQTFPRSGCNIARRS
ncbi:hypothetical protein BDY21DRAFT_74277 [Lineolata rhizophorae]|uniref:Uncharacterized protein n=1 Tax=Lineolata rhizophorae TaxID=578093 RepID=A0A6A6NU99_9PEZI|nr:hypothetical protein BDY21DRAFT_74277 [Lineolata rhizophorae]